MKKFLVITTLAASLLAAGCTATTGGASSAQGEQGVGFLPSYAKLAPVQGREGTYRYIDRSVNLNPYTKFYIDPVEVFVSQDGAYKGIQPEALNRIADTMKKAVVKQLGAANYQVVDKIGPDVLRVRLAVTGVEPARTDLGVTDFIPIKALYNAGRAAAGASPRNAEMSMEFEVLDSQNRQVAAGMSTRKSDQTLAQGDRITWNDLTPIVDAWSKQFVQGVNEARGVAPAR